MLGVKLDKFAETETADVPDPIDCAVVELTDDKELLVPHSKYAVVEDPPGFTVPLSVAELEVIDVALAVETDGPRPPVVVKE